jgi:hypothetical protein
MSSASAAPSDVQGAQQPRLCSIPDFKSSTGEEAVELAAMAGLDLDPWQQFVPNGALGERADGMWAAPQVCLVVPRQNGKGALLEARELAGLFLLEEPLIVHSAHQFDTSLEAFRRLLFLIESTPDLDRRVKRVVKSHGEEGIELKGGARIRFRTRTRGGGRGFSAACVILDEAMIIPESVFAAIFPVVSAQPNPQLWLTGSAVDQETHEDGVVFARARERGRRGDGRLAFCEWSLPYERPDDVDESALSDPVAWAEANPGLGIRISTEHVADEALAMDARTFAVERLGVGDWPDPDSSQHVIDMKLWAELVDLGSEPLDPVCFAVDVAPDRSRATIAVAAKRADGLVHVEVVRRLPGTGWVAKELARLVREHQCLTPLIDGAGPAANLLPEFNQLELGVDTAAASDMAKACGEFFDSVQERDVRHLGQSEMTAALKGAVQRPLGDAWAWSRKNSSVDISPLVACTLAVWGVRKDQVVVPMIGVVGR